MLPLGATVSLGEGVALRTSDAFGASSFDSAGNWNNGAIPSGANRYATAGFFLRSPPNSSAYTFGGDSLSVDAGGRFLMKGAGRQVMTVKNLILNGGLADFANTSTDYYTETLAGSITLQSGTRSYLGAFSGAAAAETLLVTAPVSGSGDLQIGGADVNAGEDNGVVIFAGTNSFTGATVLAGGTLLINGLGGRGDTIVTNGGTLGGIGSIGGPLTMLAGGKLAPGIPSLGTQTALLGTLTAARPATLAGTAMMRIDRSATPASDRFAAPGLTVSPGATLIVTNVGSTNLVAGDTFALFGAPINGSFKTLNLPVLPNASVAWTNKLGIDGSIAVIGINIFGVGAATPPLLAGSQSTLLAVKVTPVANPASTGIAVTGDLTPIGGSKSQPFYDDGTHGDLTAGDHVFSFNATVPANAVPGRLNLNAGICDAQGRRAAVPIALTVLPSTGPFFPAAFLPLAETNADGFLPLAAGGQMAPLYYSANDAAVVGVAASALRDDLERVTGMKPVLSTNAPVAATDVVFIGTIGQSVLIDELIAAGKLNVAEIRGRWEAYLAVVVTNPVAGVGRALVIAGSDRRGTAFGVFSLSEAIGVSPWYWWGDVPVVQRAALYVGGGSYTEHSPGVKYRGIFINDEDWGLNPWAAKTFDPGFKNIGPRTYEKVFELMLRLRLNYIWPAMHACTTEFGSVPANIALADKYGIVAGSSHCEPMLCNNVHWNEKEKGRWNYSLNRDTIHSYWEDNVKARGAGEAVWTLGIRGIHDAGMQTPPTDLAGKIDLMSQVFRDQRAMLNQNVTAGWGPIAQCFVPYKEVLPIYDAGLKVPEDVTLVWVDDNFGYLRRLSSPAERQRAGGAGVYWHISYYGPPHSYTWINTTAPALMWEELHKAWENDARVIWMLNVGDIKPMEIGVDYYSRLAWDPNGFSLGAQRKFLHDFAAKNFGAESAPAMTDLLMEFFRLGTVRKPELMNRNWALSLTPERATQLETDYRNLLKNGKSLFEALRPVQREAYTELAGFPARVLGSAGVIFMDDRKVQAGVEVAADESEIRRLRDGLQAEVRNYNTNLAGGKWNRVMPGLETEKNQGKWNSQVFWPWGESAPAKIAINTNEPPPAQQWRDAASADRRSSESSAQWDVVEGLGPSGHAVALQPASLDASWNEADTNAPSLEYDFTTQGSEAVAFVDFLPTFRICPGMRLRVAMSVDGRGPTLVEVPGSSGAENENGTIRSSAVQDNYTRARVPLPGLPAGKHTFTIRAVDPGAIIDCISLP